LPADPDAAVLDVLAIGCISLFSRW